MLSILDFLWLGQEQWRSYHHPLVRALIRLIGPLGIHARIRNAHVIHLIETVELPPGATVLDAGCGHAYALFWLASRRPDYRLCGVDIDAELIEQNKRIASALGLSNLHFTVGDVSSWSTNTSYDLVLSIDLLEHVEEDAEILTTWRRILAEGGKLVLHLPLRHQAQKRVFPVFRHHTIPDHVRDEYTQDEIQAKLAQTGFRIQSLGYGFGLPGELAFELNNLFWQQPPLRTLIALATFPAAILLGYVDCRLPPTQGNSLVILAQPR